MGLKGGSAIQVLRAQYPSAFPDNIATPDSPVQVVISDWSQEVYSLVSSANTGKVLAKKCEDKILKECQEEILSQQNGVGLETYCMLFDEGEHVPRNKSITQAKRREGEKDPPFSRAEIEDDKLGLTLDGQVPLAPRLMKTGVLVRDLYRFCAEQVMTTFGSGSTKGPRRIHIDGARVPRRVNGVPQTNPLHPHLFETEGVRVTIKRRVEYGQVVVDPLVQKPSNEIGEADLKVVNCIRKFKGKKIVVKPYDSDFILLILMNLRNFIREGWNIDMDVYVDTRTRTVDKKKNGNGNGENGNDDENENGVDTNGKTEEEEMPAKKKGAFCHLNTLWKLMWDDFRGRFPNVIFPMETFGFLVVLAGNDYCEGFHGVAFHTLWDYFCLRGKRFFGDTVDVLDEKDPKGKDKKKVPRPVPESQMISGTPEFGDPRVKHDVTIHEVKALCFIADFFWYLKDMDKKPHLDFRVEQNKFSYVHEANEAAHRLAYVSNFVLKASAKNGSKKPGILVPDGDDALSKIRRAHWNLYYIINGWKDIDKAERCYNPIAVDESSRKSLHGWLKREIFEDRFFVPYVELAHEVFTNANWFERKKILAVKGKPFEFLPG